MLRLNQIRLLILLSLIVTITSCSFEKRRYTSGYHVEWHKREHKKVVQSDVEEIASEQDNSTDSKQMSDDIHLENPPLIAEKESELVVENESESVVADNSADPVISQKTNPSIAERFLEKSKVAQKIQNSATLNALAEKSKKKKGKLGLWSGILGVGCWSVLFGDVILLVATKGAIGLEVVLGLSFLSFLFALIAFIIGIMALKKGRKGKGSGMAVLGIYLSSIYLFSVLVGVIAALAKK